MNQTFSLCYSLLFFFILPFYTGENVYNVITYKLTLCICGWFSTSSDELVSSSASWVYPKLTANSGNSETATSATSGTAAASGTATSAASGTATSGTSSSYNYKIFISGLIK